MGTNDHVPVNEALEYKGVSRTEPGGAYTHRDLIVLLFAAVVFLGCIASPPSLLDDVDAVQAQIGRNMLESRDWVTARLDGVAYLEKAPLPYWLMAISYRLLGVHDWVARLWLVTGIIALCLVTRRFARWAFGERAGLYAGLALATCVGLWLFTRILIPDALLTLTISVGLWAFLRALDEDEPHPGRWAMLLAASLGLGLLLKGLIALVLPGGAALVYLLATRQLFSGHARRRLRPFSGLLVMLVIAAPWHVLATLRNPPYFDFTMHSGPGEYRGFLWFYFINEQLLRFLNLRYPRDYNTVPRVWFWLLHLVWLFPWSAFFPALARLSYKPIDRAARARLLALCWAGFVMVFFTFSTTQEYYSMPLYPALALLIGSAMAAEGRWVHVGTRVVAAIATLLAIASGTVLYLVRGLPTPGDIAPALTQNPELYTLSLGHMADLTLRSFAYLRLPLGVAGLAFLLGAVALWALRGWRAFLAMALMMVLFFHAARLAMVVFDPYMSSRPLADALLRAPPGRLVVANHYYSFSSVFFYTNRPALLLNGRKTTLEYGSYAPGAPNVFIGDADFARLWSQSDRYYLLVDSSLISQVERLADRVNFYTVAVSGGKFLLTNLPLSSSGEALPAALRSKGE
jgi:4-amino-4-deoxy-L-arabinose transferase-like glycosyltransferase